ncbi:MAG: replicative DNA helicase [Chloroflexi bacterium]|nr:replicative DNA helicase [Chloroflexota bacterium]
MTDFVSSTRISPHNVEAEEAVLGSVLIQADAFFNVAQFLRAEDFYIVKNRWIWEAFVELHDQRAPIDFLTVTEELERRGRLAEAGGAAYLTGLMNAVPTAINAEAYGRIVEQSAVRRRLLQAANDIATLAYESETRIDEVVDQAEQVLFGVTERRLTRDLRPIKQVVSEYYDRIQYLYDHRDEPLGVPTGFLDLDKLLGGMQKSDLLIVAGRPGQGKSAFLMSVAKHAAQVHKKHVAVFSLEMSNEQLVQRLISQETKIDAQRLRLGQLREDEMDTFVHAVSVLGGTPIYLDDTPAIGALELRTKCRRLHAEYALDLIIVDYLQLMTGDTRSENRVQEVSYISRNLKTLARELNVPVLVAAQLSRAVEQRHGQRPMLSDLRESGSIEQDSDVVMFIYHPDDWDNDPVKKDISTILLEKHRNGPVGQVDLVFLKSMAKFESVVKRSLGTADT